MQMENLLNILYRMSQEAGSHTDLWRKLHLYLDDMQNELQDKRDKLILAEQERKANQDLVHFAITAERTRIIFDIRMLAQELGELPTISDLEKIIWKEKK